MGQDQYARPIRADLEVEFCQSWRMAMRKSYGIRRRAPLASWTNPAAHSIGVWLLGLTSMHFTPFEASAEPSTTSRARIPLYAPSAKSEPSEAKRRRGDSQDERIAVWVEADTIQTGIDSIIRFSVEIQNGGESELQFGDPQEAVEVNLVDRQTGLVVSLPLPAFPFGNCSRTPGDSKPKEDVQQRKNSERSFELLGDNRPGEVNNTASPSSKVHSGSVSLHSKESLVLNFGIVNVLADPAQYLREQLKVEESETDDDIVIVSTRPPDASRKIETKPIGAGDYELQVAVWVPSQDRPGAHTRLQSAPLRITTRGE